ncbi:hypothetical protein Bpfe_015038, partial [Biomphalaria pfeifferi]
EIMKLLLIVAAVIAAASAKAVSLNDLVIDPNWIHTLGKKEENFNLAEIVANIGKVIHVIDGFVTGAAAKRAVCFHVLGAEVCADPTVSGKREEDFDVAEIVANIGKVVHIIDGFVSGVTARDVENFNLSQIVANLGNVIHVIDGFVSGVAAKRAVCFHVLGAEVCADPTVSGKREENFNLAEIVANIGKVIHVIDGFVSGITARDLENFNLAEIVANIGKVIHVIDGFVSGVAARNIENFDLSQLVANIGNVIHIIDGFVSGAAAKRAVCFHVLGAEVCADPTVSGKREENFNLAEIVANIGKVIHVIDGFVSGTTTGAKREEQDICLTISGVNVCL